MTSTYRKLILILMAVLLIGSAAAAVTVTGKVTNATTGKPASGDTVELLALQQGMSVLSSTKTDAAGSFSFNIDEPNSPHLVRVNHAGVSYFPAGGPIRPGQTTTSIDVYDSAGKLEGVSTNVNVVRLQADGSTLQAVELIAVRNASNPPRTVAGEKTYEFYLPENAQIDQVMAEAPGGMAVTVPATPAAERGKYSLKYAIKPGETRFEVAYHLPYAGKASFTPKVTGDVQHFVVMMPKSMTFEAVNGAKFAPMDDKTVSIQVATNVNASSNLAFRISGTGMLQEEQAAQAQSDSGAQAGTMPDNRPGGGLGPPTDAPDPLHSYRWPILAGLGIILACGAMFVISRPAQQGTTIASTQARPVATAAGTPARPAAPPAPTDRSAMLLEGLKEELFQLELDKQQGRISESDYQLAKSALDQTLKRALARKSSSS